MTAKIVKRVDRDGPGLWLFIEGDEKGVAFPIKRGSEWPIEEEEVEAIRDACIAWLKDKK